MNKIKVLIVDDSAFMRKMLSEIINSNAKMEVVGTARDGADALKKAKELDPDVITLDIEMPNLNGLDTLKLIMSNKPKPVVMVSSTTTEGATNTILAMQYGAVDFIAKPSGAISLDIKKIEGQLIEKVLLAATAKIQNKHKHVLSFKERDSLKHSIKNNEIYKNKSDKKIVCIGVSTGGPKALQTIIPKINKNIEGPILIVQHMPAGFTKSLAERLNRLSELKVKEAEDNEILENGSVYIAPGGFHMEVKQDREQLRIHLNEKPPLKGHRPSVNRLFSSVARIEGYSKVAVIMTGMGNDGSDGLVALKEKNNVYAIAESEESCVVFGMPKSAINTNLVDKVTHLNNIPFVINQLFSK